jgi:hypothetical protein
MKTVAGREPFRDRITVPSEKTVNCFLAKNGYEYGKVNPSPSPSFWCPALVVV